ncbi:carbohydrate ABC transporter permease [Caloramator sp. CAR-1]|uniref:carbohydrate ABC transporter permease n=1 Tax=Caloramator sp. CAR-1 TaxID=3062777 RepID=UPI0026E423C1|nr:carbohydrate ABC transporter permease [Caloramator sp. CAR-1]MDO6356033.1 carbohydrate ABC transporter permease [Caloramator sp. CAR-1]
MRAEIKRLDYKKLNINTSKLLKIKYGEKIEILAVYFFLILIGFVFLYPIIYMISYSLMDTKDLINPLIKWIPSKLYLGNFVEANKVLEFFPSLIKTLYVTIIPAVLQTIAASVIGYGFARFKFPFKNILLALVVATFIIPPQVTMIPQFLMYKNLGLIGSVLSYILPAVLGQGIKSAIFILIFYQFFKMLPKSLEEAAQIDGAGYLRIFFTIAVPSAIPAYVISFLFSFVWYWNETTLAALYFGDVIKTLPLQLQNFAATFQKLYPVDPNGQTGKNLNEAINMAGTFLNILPLLIIYFFTQRWFVESIDRTGITGE